MEEAIWFSGLWGGLAARAVLALEAADGELFVAHTYPPLDTGVMMTHNGREGNEVISLYQVKWMGAGGNIMGNGI
jgi:hypothetical protein